MFPVLLASLIISTSAAELGKAPQPPEWAQGLPGAIQRDGGTFLPAPMDHEVLRRLVFLERYPELCQAAIDAVAKVKDADLAAKQRIYEASVVEDAADDGWPTWQVFAVGAAAAVLGGYVGYAFGVTHGSK